MEHQILRKVLTKLDMICSRKVKQILKGCHLQKMLYSCTLLVVTTKPKFCFSVKLQMQTVRTLQETGGWGDMDSEKLNMVWSRIPAIPDA